MERYTPSPAELNCGADRLLWAEGLIVQLPADHDGRNGWLLNYGRCAEAQDMRKQRGLSWDRPTQAARLPNLIERVFGRHRR